MLDPYPGSSSYHKLIDYLYALLMRHEAEDGEDDHGGEERGEGVDATHDNGIPAIKHRLETSSAVDWTPIVCSLTKDE